jgi:hypothetical protein
MFDNRMTRGVLALALGAGLRGDRRRGVDGGLGYHPFTGLPQDLRASHHEGRHRQVRCGRGRRTLRRVRHPDRGNADPGQEQGDYRPHRCRTSPGEGSCAAGRVEYDFTGTVTAGTSIYVTVDDTVSYDVCVNSTTHVVNLIRRTTGSF